MDNFNNIPTSAKWSEIATLLNTNFSLAYSQLVQLATSTTKSKGLYPTEVALKVAVPFPLAGDWACVGNTIPATIYLCTTKGVWTNTHAVGGGDRIDLSNYSTKANVTTQITNLRTEISEEFSTKENLSDQISILENKIKRDFVTKDNLDSEKVSLEKIVLAEESRAKKIEGELAILTTDNKDSLASAINSLKSNFNSVFGPDRNVETTWLSAYVNASDVITSSLASKCSQPIALKKGETIRVGTTGSYTKAIVVTYDGSSVRVGSTINEVRSVAKSLDEFGFVNYKAEYDCYVIVSVSNQESEVKIRPVDSVTRNDELQKDFESLTGGEIVINPKWAYGYVNASSKRITAAATSLFSQPIAMRKGDKITVSSYNSYQSFITIIKSSNSIEIGDELQVINAISKPSTEYGSVTYTATSDCNVVLSVHKDNPKVSMRTGGTIDKLEANIMDVVGGERQIEPSWSVGYVSNDNGVVKLSPSSSGTSRFTQPIALRKGDTINVGTKGAYSYLITIIKDNMSVAVGQALTPISFVGKNSELFTYTKYTAPENCYAIVSTALGSEVYIEKPNLLELSANGDYGEYYGKYTEELGYRRTQQQTDLTYTFKGAVPDRHGNSFAVGTPITGLPYSETMETDKRVGWDVSIHTFMTAVNNPYSLLYTEDINAARSRSAYGITYHGDGNSGAYYGGVCNTFAMLGAGGLIPYTTYQIWENRTDLFEKVSDQSIRGLELMDLIGVKGHVLVVTKLWKDKYGINERVQISEEGGIKALNRAPMDAAQFAAFLANGDSNGAYTVMRYKKQSDCIDYIASPYVPIRDEVAKSITYNNEICTIYGDEACILEGDILHISYTNEKDANNNYKYTHMRVYKDGSLFHTLVLDNSEHDMDLLAKGVTDEKQYTYGLYEACLANGSTESARTKWEIIGVNASLNGTELTFSSPNGTPLYWDWQRLNGGSWKSIAFTEAERRNGFANVNQKYVRQPGDPANYDEYNYCLKIHVQGKYGRVGKRIVP